MTSPIPTGRRTSVYELPPRPRTKTEWLGALLLGAVFFVSGALILAHRPLVVERFLEWGYPTKWMTVVGAVEVLAAVLLVIPRFARHGAMILIVMMLGAMFTHFAHGEYFAAIVPLTLVLALGSLTAFELKRLSEGLVRVRRRPEPSVNL